MTISKRIYIAVNECWLLGVEPNTLILTKGDHDAYLQEQGMPIDLKLTGTNVLDCALMVSIISISKYIPQRFNRSMIGVVKPLQIGGSGVPGIPSIEISSMMRMFDLETMQEINLYPTKEDINNHINQTNG